MAEIIDLDFYRKFRVILPVRGALLEEKGKKSNVVRKAQARRYYRRRKHAPTDKPNDTHKTPY